MVVPGYLQTPIRVFIADAYPVIRTGLYTTVGSDAYMDVVGSATCRHDLATVLQAIRADVLVINLIGMGDASISLLRDIIQFNPSLGIVVFAATAEFAPEFVAVGVRGYISYEESDEQVLIAIRAVNAGKTYLSPSIQDYLDRCSVLSAQHRFAPRELQVIKYMAQGLDTGEIAKCLDLSFMTVRNYVWRIRKKTGWTTWPQMVSWYNAMYGSEAGRSASFSGRT
jgi:DNA-binding NarL/FixJ family response regulator